MKTLEQGYIVSDRFQVDSLIGHGGMGSVYRAVQLSLGRMIALKVLRSDSTWQESRSLTKRFFQEASLCSSLSHKNIVTIFDYGYSEDDDLHYIAMELLAGETLGERLARGGPLSVSEALFVITEVALALRHAHQRGALHRDLKPENVMLSNDPAERSVTLLDFGLVKPLQSSSQLTTTGTYIGSPSYMSPEQINGAPLDARSDLYSLGVVLYQSLSGRLPFREATPIKTMMAHLSQRPPRLSAQSQVPPRVERLVHQLLEKDPASRPQSAEELLTALRALSQSEAQPPTTVTRLPLSAQPACLWVLSQDPAIRSPEVQQALALLRQQYQVVQVPTEGSAEWAHRVEGGSLLPPWVVLFGDMQVLIEDPLLKTLHQFGTLAKVLISTHYNTELLQHSVNFCGLDQHLSLPSSPEEIAEVIRGMMARVLLLRRRYDRAE